MTHKVTIWHYVSKEIEVDVITSPANTSIAPLAAPARLLDAACSARRLLELSAHAFWPLMPATLGS